MSVVGIDFGLDSCYIAVARAGGIETIANDYSLRATPSVVAFGDKMRVLGVSAKNQLLTNLKKSFFAFKPFLGRRFSDPVTQKEAGRLPYPVLEAPDGGILVKVNFGGADHVFSPEQLTAMLFTKLKETAEQALSTKVKDVVISVPIYYTDKERRAMLDAAGIAGFNVLKLMNDTTATALAYGIYKQDLPAPEEKARNVVFVDCGHRGAQVAACSFNKGKLVMQSCAFDDDCGGRNFNEVLATYFTEDFKKRYRVDAATNPKALLKLMNEVEKVKKQMSANTNKLPLSIECFMDDKDVSGSVNRETFESLIATPLHKIEAILRSCLATSKWKPEDIYSVEIVGGSTRVPAIKALIEKIFNKSPNTTLNADEAVARGCALQCAILSPTFKVREFSVTDIQPFPIKLNWQAESDNGDMEVFPQFHAVPFSKMLTFYRREEFSVQGEYDGAAPIADQHIGRFEIGEVKPMPDGSNQKVKVKIRVNLNGIFTVASASIQEKHEIEEEVPMEVDAPKDEKKEGDNAAAAASTEEPMDSSQGQQQDPPPQPDGAPPAPAKEGDAAKKDPPKMVKRKKVVNKTIELPVTIRAGSLSRDRLERLTAVETELAAGDAREQDRLNSKNSVEEYIYEIRSKISDELSEYMTDDDRESFSKVLQETEDWLYEDGEDCDKPTYDNKLKELRLRGEPVKVSRYYFQ